MSPLGDNKLSPGFIDDSMVLAIGDSLAQCHEKLKDMMEWLGGGFSWSLSHNSPFELMKTALMNFSRSFRDSIPGPLSLNKLNPDGSVMMSLTHPVLSYKYLGVIFDPKLWWSLWHKKALAAATFWASHIGHLLKAGSRLSTACAKQLYNTVTVLKFSYGAEVWYTHVYKPPRATKSNGSVSITRRLRSCCEYTDIFPFSFIIYSLYYFSNIFLTLII